MTISVRSGTKGRGDLVVYYNDTPITLKEFGQIFALICRNEDRIYPKPKFQGSDLFISYLLDVKKIGSVTPEILKKYGLWRHGN